jgi:hypothetical protein
MYVYFDVKCQTKKKRQVLSKREKATSKKMFGLYGKKKNNDFSARKKNALEQA